MDWGREDSNLQPHPRVVTRSNGRVQFQIELRPHNPGQFKLAGEIISAFRLLDWLVKKTPQIFRAFKPVGVDQPYQGGIHHNREISWGG